MGPRDFKKVFPPTMVGSKAQVLAGIRSLSIDAMGRIYRGLKSVLLSNASGDATSHLRYILDDVVWFHKNGIKCIWCFDSPKPPKLKLKTNVKRRHVREQAANALANANAAYAAKQEYVQPPDNSFSLELDESLKELDIQKFIVPKKSDEEKIDDLKKQAIYATKKHIEDAQYILTLMGVPWVTAPDEYEGEHLAAELCKTGVVDAVWSDDMDALAFGAPVVISHASHKKVAAKVEYHKYVLGTVLDTVFGKVTQQYERLVKICVLLGNDLVDRYPGMGPVNVIKKYMEIECDPLQREVFYSYVQPCPLVNIPTSLDNSATNENLDKLLEYLVSHGFARDLNAKKLSALRH